MLRATQLRIAAFALAGSVLTASGAAANPFLLFAPFAPPPQVQAPAPQVDEQITEAPSGTELPARLKRQVVAYAGREAPGTVIVDTANTHLYFVLGGGKAMRYGIGVGRDGFRWSGVQAISRKAEWPDWHPPAEMIARQPYLPRFMAGGPSNPLGARAMYLGNTIYRIHGTNNPSTIGGRVSSGCIRMVNDDVIDLYARVGVGTKVIVLPSLREADLGRGQAAAYAPTRVSAAQATWNRIGAGIR